MPEIPNGLTFEQLLLPPGIVVAGAIISGLVQLLKRVFPNLPLNGLQQAFIYSVVLYVLTAFAVGVSSLNDGLLVFTAWLTCAGAAVTTYEVGKDIVEARSKPETKTIIGRDEKFDDGT